MKTKEEYIVMLKKFKEKHASRYGIRSIGIFGSVARGENRLDPFVMFDIREALQSLFGCKVDLVRLRQGLRSSLLKRIEKEGIPV